MYTYCVYTIYICAAMCPMRVQPITSTAEHFESASQEFTSC